ncbi:MAG TPA: helicase-associated domain-containing protein, partial [Lacisediminihabitans sp.]|uniref:helicase-associated domain-containing protein n=1 Tax=Lacisediminihabitans sp. TaxID=2787631 RepID=UPI002EDAFB9A
AGETAESMLEFLRGISLTGIPQPLDYLIGEASARYGLVRVGSLDEPDAQSYLRSDDEQLLGTIMVDQNLSALGLSRVEPARVVSRFPLEVVFWTLSDARYPVAAETESGEIVALRRQRTAKAATAGGADPVAALIERLRLGSAAQGEATDQAWLIRQLEVAIKARAALTVSVLMPGGAVLDYELEPTSVGGGRVRARDKKSAIERTLPLSRITRIGPAS